MKRKDVDVVAIIEREKFQRILDSLHPINQYVLFEFKPSKGFRVVLRDYNNMVHGELYVDMDAFKGMEAGHEQVYRFGVDTNKLRSEFMNQYRGKDTDVVMEYSSEQGRVILSIGNLTKSFTTSRVYGTWYDFDPKFEHSSEFEILRSEFRRGVIAIQGMDKFVQVSVNRNTVQIYGSDGGDDVETNFKLGDDLLLCLDYGEDVRSVFTVEEMLMGLSAVGRDPLIRFSMGEDLPMRMVWIPFEGAVMRLHVAPQIGV